MNKRIKSIWLFYLIIFFTGFSFLLFEVSWFRMLSLVIGTTVSASTIVLVAFMSGLGVGAYFWGKRVARVVHPIKLLCYLFIVIGVLGFTNYFLIGDFIPWLYSFFSTTRFSVNLIELFIFLLSVLFLFLPAFLMGGILPIISKIIIDINHTVSGTIGKIYAFETLGSTIGGFMTGFFLIGSFGQKYTIFFAVLINLMMVVILLISKKLNAPKLIDELIEEVPEIKTKLEKKEIANDVNRFAINKKIAILATFICGFVVVGMQVIWLRIFKVYMTNTSYTFTLIASMVILGLFAGSWLYSKKNHIIKDRNLILLKLILYIGFFLLLGFFILLKLPTLLFFPLGSLHETYIIRIIVIPFIASLFIIIPVTLISGYIFPLTCTMYSSDYKNISQSIGSLLLSNTVGSVLGPLFAAYIFIPYLGSALSVLIFLCILLIVALLIARKISVVKKANTIRLGLMISIAILFVVLIVHPKLYILPPSFSKYQKKILDYKESIEGIYVVGEESTDGNVVMSTYVNNSSVIGSTYDAIKAVKMVGHIPFFSGLKCKNALVVGFGIGVTCSAIASHPEVESIDCVELVAGLKNAAHNYSELNNDIDRDSRLNVHSGDGRHYLQFTSKKYDLISSDPTHPILGSGNIYTKEYFELCKSRLNKGGMVSQYLPIHKLLRKDLMGIIKTFHSVFPDASVWIGHYHLILIGSNGAPKIDFVKWTENISKSEKDIFFYKNPYHIAACMIMDSAQIVKTTKDIKINTDDFSYVEFFSLSSFNSDNLTKNLDYLSNNRVKNNGVFYNIYDQLKMERFIKGNELLTNGLYYFLQGNTNEFKNQLLKACEANPEDEEFPFLIKFYFR